MSTLSMSDPVLYHNYNKLQRRDNIRCLRENRDRIVWRGGDRVLDIGSGDGSFTVTELRQFLPDDVTLVGCDRNPAMVDFANQHYAHTGITFEMVEIGKRLPEKYVGSYDHVFAFYSLHWVRDQRLAVSQIYDILSVGGDCLVIMVGHFPSIFDVYKAFAESPKWRRWVTRIEEVISPYHDCDDSEDKLRKIVEEAGLKNVFVECHHTSFTYDSVEDFKRMIIAVNPFPIPEELHEEYLEDFVRESRRRGYIADDLTINYATNTFYGSKS